MLSFQPSVPIRALIVLPNRPQGCHSIRVPSWVDSEAATEVPSVSSEWRSRTSECGPCPTIHDYTEFPPEMDIPSRLWWEEDEYVWSHNELCLWGSHIHLSTYLIIFSRGTEDLPGKILLEVCYSGLSGDADEGSFEWSQRGRTIRLEEEVDLSESSQTRSNR